MPILNLHYGGEGVTSKGKKIKIPPRVILRERGPLIQVAVSHEQNIAAELTKQGETLPNPISGFALIDSGASITCIDNEVAQKLSLPVIDKVNMVSASHTSEQPVYPAKFEIIGFGITLNSQRSMGAELQKQGIIGLLGRDLLEHCIIFNGVDGSISLSL